jgi:hypothetical protein
VWCSLWGKDWLLKYYLDDLRLQMVKPRYVKPFLAQAMSRGCPASWQYFLEFYSSTEQKAGHQYSLTTTTVFSGYTSWPTSLLAYNSVCFFLYVIHGFTSWGSSVSLGLHTGWPGDRGSIPSEGKEFFLWPICPDRLCGPTSLLFNGYLGSFHCAFVKFTQIM